MNVPDKDSADVSVVLPTWNRPQFLKATLDSVFAQTVAFRELIIADDGSDAPTRTILEACAVMPGVRVLWRSHCGNPGAVRNGAIREAKGRYIAFADSDDLWHPQKLERQLEALRARPECRWSYTSCTCIDAQGQPIASMNQDHSPVRGSLLESLARCQGRVPLPSVLAERSLLLAAGLFEETIGCYADYDLWVRMAAMSNAAALPDSLVSVRLHDRHFSRGSSFASLSGREKFLARAQTLVHSPRVRTQVQRMRAIDCARLARLAALAGDTAESTFRLRASLGNGWSEPRWWVNAARTHSHLFSLRARRLLERLR